MGMVAIIVAKTNLVESLIAELTRKLGSECAKQISVVIGNSSFGICICKVIEWVK